MNSSNSPKFTQNTLFLASSGDISNKRIEAYKILSAYFERKSANIPIGVFEWETCTADAPFDTRMTMQGNLPRPSDEFCIGVIGLFGERIGHAMPNPEAELIDRLNPWKDDSLPFRLVIDWPIDWGKQKELVQNGCFPLTGPVYEVLEGLAVGKPVSIIHFAERPYEIGKEPDDYFEKSWCDETSIKIKRNNEKINWLEKEYYIQTKALANFLSAIMHESRAIVSISKNESIEKPIEMFVKKIVFPRIGVQIDDDMTNPFKMLDYFDINDPQPLPGRKALIQTKVTEFIERALKSHPKPAIMQISGESGCGKTSFMRRGILAELTAPSQKGRFTVAAFRPTDFHDQNGLPDRQIIIRLVKLITLEFPNLLTLPEWHKIENSGHNAPEIASKILSEAIERAHGLEVMVIGLDQFEEILDDLTSQKRKTNAPYWLPLLKFIDLACQTGNFGFVYTLESAREETFDGLDTIPQALRNFISASLGGISDDILDAIISGPFEANGLPISNEIVKKLRTGFKDFSKNNQSSSSALPLLSLKLYGLFEICREIPKGNNDKEQSIRTSFDSKEIITLKQLEELNFNFDFDLEISNLAENAWAKTRSSNQKDEIALNKYLQPLIALSGDDFERITLQTVSIESHLNEKIKPFIDARLVVASNKRARFVHEAVIRNWGPARDWFNSSREYLIREADARIVAARWVRSGAEITKLSDFNISIELASEILINNIQDWSQRNNEDEDFADRKLKAMCIAVFSNSETPLAPVPALFDKASSHLSIAIQYKLKDIVEKFIAIEPSCVNAKFENGNNACFNAAYSTTEILKILLKAGANPLIKNDDGWSCFSVIVYLNDYEKFKLIRHFLNSDEDYLVKDGWTVFHSAASKCAPDFLQALLSYDDFIPKVFDKTIYGPPIFYSYENDNLENFKILQNHFDIKELNIHNQSLLHMAAEKGAKKIAKYLLTEPSFEHLIGHSDSFGQTALAVAARSHKHEMVEILMKIETTCEHQLKIGLLPPLHSAILGWWNGADFEKITLTQDHLIGAERTVAEILKDPDINPREVVILSDDKKVEPIQLAKKMPRIKSLLIAHPNFSQTILLPDGTLPIIALIRSKDRKLVERVLKRDSYDWQFINDNGFGIDSELIENGLSDLLIPLIEQNILDVWSEGATTKNGFIQAIFSQNRPLVDLYISKLPDIKSDYVINRIWRAAAEAIGTKLEELTVEFFEKFNLPSLGSSELYNSDILFKAARSGSLETFNYLIAHLVGELPRDEIGRFPSDVAPDALRAEFLAAEHHERNVKFSEITISPSDFSISGPEWSLDPRQEWQLEIIGETIDASLLISESTIVETRRAPFNPNIELLRVSDTNWDKPAHVFYIRAEDNLFRLNGTSPPIHEVNKKYKIQLNDDNILSYLSFFCFFVRGEEGPFLILNDINNPLLPKELYLPENIEIYEKLKSIISKPRYWGKTETGNFVVSAQIFYGNAIFLAKLLIQPSGMIDMLDDEPILTDLPFIVNQPIT